MNKERPTNENLLSFRTGMARITQCWMISSALGWSQAAKEGAPASAIFVDAEENSSVESTRPGAFFFYVKAFVRLLEQKQFN